jgi:hypothetical protein
VGNQSKAEAFNSNIHQMESKALALAKFAKAEALNSNVHQMESKALALGKPV